jgi:tetratricopeptide (TPR) repeat protein
MNFDELRFRAPAEMNAIIRRIAPEYDAVVVDVQGHLASFSPGNLIGDELMTEHLHPNVEGYFLVADAFYDTMLGRSLASADVVRVGRERARQHIVITPVDSLAGAFRIAQLKGQWPFQAMGTVVDFLDTLTIRSDLDHLAVEMFKENMPWFLAREQEKEFYEARGDFEGVFLVSRAQVLEMPMIHNSYVTAASALVRMRRLPEAYNWFALSVAIRETPVARRMMGAVLLEMGRREEAVAHLERAVVLEPANPQALYNLAGAYALGGDYDRSRAMIGRLLEVAPQHTDGQRLLASLPR